jgi:hypothetical protein
MEQGICRGATDRSNKERITISKAVLVIFFCGSGTPVEELQWLNLFCIGYIECYCLAQFDTRGIGSVYPGLGLYVVATGFQKPYAKSKSGRNLAL